MSNSSGYAVIESDQLQSIALQYAQCIDDHMDGQVCLPQQIAENISTDTALELLYRPLPSFKQRGDVQVCQAIHCVCSF